MEFWQDLDFLGPAGLEIVDIMEDRGIYMVVDEGCTRTCHGKSWIQNARIKLLGYDNRTIEPTRGSSKKYSGLGHTYSAGWTTIPYGIRLENGIILQGALSQMS